MSKLYKHSRKTKRDVIEFDPIQNLSIDFLNADFLKTRSISRKVAWSIIVQRIFSRLALCEKTKQAATSPIVPQKKPAPTQPMTRMKYCNTSMSLASDGDELKLKTSDSRTDKVGKYYRNLCYDHIRFQGNAETACR